MKIQDGDRITDDVKMRPTILITKFGSNISNRC